jgi:hypothetical protein
MVPREHGLSRAAAAQLRLLVCAASSHHLPGAPAANVWAQLRLLCAACRSTANTSRRQHPYKPPGQGEQQHDQQQRPDQDHGCIGSALSSGGSAPPQPLPQVLLMEVLEARGALLQQLGRAEEARQCSALADAVAAELSGGKK